MAKSPSTTLGQYRLIAELGRGGMAEVYLAVTAGRGMFSKLVVVKKPREHIAEDAEFMTMLVDEARIAARLNHPNLVQTLEVGDVNGQYFLTMEYLDGQPLHRLLNRCRATWPLDHALTVMADVLGGIHYAHELKDYDGTPLGIVHRDVTPHNVFITYEGQVKVVDFGIAKAAGRASETRHGVVKGKIPYMAPEQASGGDVDRRVDVFAVGVMLYEAAIRGRMWKGRSETDTIRDLVSGNIPSSPKLIDPTIDDELDRICKKALAFDRNARYETAAAFQKDLELFMHKRGPRCGPRELGAQVAEVFADKRATTDKIIERQLAQWRSEKSSEVEVISAPNSMGGGPASSSSISSSIVKQTSGPVSAQPDSSVKSGGVSVDDEALTTLRAGGPPPPPSVAAAVVLPAAPPPPNRTLLIAVIGIALAVLAGGATMIALRASKTGKPTTTATGGNSKGDKPITVTLRATPLETRFAIDDDGALLENPFIGTFPRDGKQHRIRAVAPGYPPKDETITFDDDVSMRFTLSMSGGKKK